MQKVRPVNLKLTSMRFPLTAIVSIMHRLSGLFLFVLLPLALWMLHDLFSSPTQFQVWAVYLTGFWGRFLLWFVLAGLSYHLVAGLRHLLMDYGIGETLKGGRLGAIFALLIWFVFIITIGVLLCVGIL